MRKKNINIAIICVLFILAIGQLLLRNNYMNELNELDNITIETLNENNVTLSDTNILNIIKEIESNMVEINSLRKVNNQWIGNLTFQGNDLELLEYINRLDNLEIGVENYVIEKVENITCYLEVQLP